MTDDRSRAVKVREVAGAIGEVAATAVLVSTAVLALTLTIGAIHFFTKVW